MRVLLDTIVSNVQTQWGQCYTWKEMSEQVPTSSVSHRGATSFSCLLQVMVVGQDLHQEVQLQSLRLKDSEWFNDSTFQPNFRAYNKCQRSLHLRPLVLDAPDAAGTVHHRVLWHDLARVDLAAGTHDAAAGEDHVSAEIGWEQKKMQHGRATRKNIGIFIFKR